jgi:hypothetical protein
MYCRVCGAFVGLGNPHGGPKEPARNPSYLPPQQPFSWTIAGKGRITALSPGA